MKKLVLFLGATASGKSSLAHSLAPCFDAEIVSADSQQVYLGMDIATAKPTPDERSEVPYHLIDLLPPDKPFDLGQFLQHAEKAIAEIWQRKKNVFVVGGTGLYIRSLLYGVSPLPKRDEAFRKHLAKLQAEKGKQFLYNELAQQDPLFAKNLHPYHSSRITRALELMYLTGKKASDLLVLEQEQERYSSFKIGLQLERDELYQRINKRVDQMMDDGFLDEVKHLLRHYSPDEQAFRAVGYKEMIAHLQGEKSLDEALSEMKQNTRKYAKRQLTWLRKEKDVHWYHPDERDKIRKDLELAITS